MASRRLFMPPALENVDELDNWLREVEIWQCVTDLDKKKQGPAIYLSLSEKIRQSCSDVAVSDLSDERGVEVLTAKLKKMYAIDSNTLAFMAYDKFETFQRPRDMNMIDYINEFDKRYNKIRTYKMDLPTAVLAYRLLKSANISMEKQQLVRATLRDLTFDTMKKQLKAIHESCGDNLGVDVSVKVESDVYLAQNQEDVEKVHYGKSSYRGRNQWRGRGSYRGNRRDNHDSWVKKENYDNWGRKLNPLDSSGNPSRCSVCQSILHWAKDCKDKIENRDAKEYKVNLFTKELHECYIEKFVGETLDSAVLDSGCTKTVCGEAWLNCYVDGLSVEDQRKVKEIPSSTKFRFGDGDVIHSLRCVSIPAYIANTDVTISTDVVSCELPLLLSKNAMRLAKTKIDFVGEKVNMFGKEFQVDITSSGHYSIPISKSKTIIEKIESEKEREYALISISDLEMKATPEKRKIADKLHKQFGHPTASKLQKLVKLSGINDEELSGLILSVSEECNTCTRYKKRELKPVVGLTLANEFNGVMAMDLKHIKNFQILHMIDLATRFSAGAIVRSKHKEEIIDKIFKHWISLFGSPKMVLSDNGGEFNNELLRELGERFDVTIKTTAAESPWSNGTVERHNGVLGNMVIKILDDVKCSNEVALAWALSAKNALQNNFGYSPNQLVFGHNPNLPNVLCSRPPALESRMNSSELILQHLDAMQRARKAFIECEASEKIKRALRSKTRSVTGIKYEVGDTVYYKRNDAKEWKGPGKVIGSENKQVLVRHGGICVRVHPCSLQHAKEKEEVREESVTENEIEETRRTEKNIIRSEDASYTSEEDLEMIATPESAEDSLDADGKDSRQVAEGLEEHYRNESEEIGAENNTNIIAIENPTRINGELPKVKSKITYCDPESKNWKIAQVLSRAGKATGKHRYWMHLADEDGVIKSVNLEAIEGWENVVEEVLLTNTESFGISKAKVKELENWREHKVFKDVLDVGQKALSVRWVITEKYKDGIPEKKARLVVRGFEEDNTEQLRTDSPTCCRENFRLVLSILVAFGWEVNTLDIKSAFLQGSEIKRDLFIKPPKEAGTDKLWKLLRTVYGLCDAPRAWYLSVKEVLERCDLKKSKFDDAIFYWMKDGKLKGLICCHVDDFCWGGTAQFEMEVIQKIRIEFKTSKEEKETFKYLGLNIKRVKDEIQIHQDEYINEVRPVEINRERKLALGDKLSSKETRQLRGIAGQLNWVSSQTRPDMAYSACETSVSIRNPTVRDLVQANKHIKKLNAERVQLKIKKICLKSARIVCYTDASFANLRDGASQGGYIIFLVGKDGKYSPLTWKSKKLKRVVKSTLSAETLALEEGIEACFMLKSILCEILGFCEKDKILPIECTTDNKSLLEAVYSTKTLTEKRLKVDICVIREMIAKGEVHSVKWQDGKYQLADCLTKAGASCSRLLEVLRSSCGMRL